jgi:hypothetical protein
MQAVRRRMQKMRPGMPKHDAVIRITLSAKASKSFFKYTL